MTPADGMAVAFCVILSFLFKFTREATETGGELFVGSIQIGIRTWALLMAMVFLGIQNWMLNTRQTFLQRNLEKIAEESKKTSEEVKRLQNRIDEK